MRDNGLATDCATSRVRFLECGAHRGGANILPEVRPEETLGSCGPANPLVGAPRVRMADLLFLAGRSSPNMRVKMRRLLLCIGIALWFRWSLDLPSWVTRPLKKLSRGWMLERGIVAVIGLPDDGVDVLVDLCKSSELIVYFQTADAVVANKARQAASDAQNYSANDCLSSTPTAASIQMGHNVADRVWVAQKLTPEISRKETPSRAPTAWDCLLGDESVVKPVPMARTIGPIPIMVPTTIPSLMTSWCEVAFARSSSAIRCSARCRSKA